jgi:glycosyltransferase involved in cell wall biosynthesis
VYPGIIPAVNYGGTERVIWYLAQELKAMGHLVTFLVNEHSSCPFAKVIFIKKGVSLNAQIPDDVDIAHFNFQPEEPISKPFVVTIHGNCNDNREFDANTIFVSGNHAARYGSSSFVYNGLNWNDYSKPDFAVKRSYFHFLGNAAWRLKNVAGAISVAQKAKKELRVIGGSRLNFKMGFRFTLSPRVKFFGMVGGRIKDQLINGSNGLIFPVRWHEPFGLAVIESLFYGCPVFATPYGSLPELVTPDVGLLSSSSEELSKAVTNSGSFNSGKCNEYARARFNSKDMTLSYLSKYELVLNGKKLNEKKPQCVTIQKEKFLTFN